VLHTRIDNPHRDRIHQVLFDPDPSSSLAVTIGYDGRFKFWELITATTTTTTTLREKKEYKTTSMWSCRSVGFFRDYPCRSAAFSKDGSVLAVSYGQIITLWDPSTNMLKRTLSQSAPCDSVEHMAFLSQKPYLVASTAQTLCVWDLLLCTVRWKITNISVMAIAVDEHTPHFAVLMKGGRLYKTVDDYHHRREEGGGGEGVCNQYSSNDRFFFKIHS
jgi:NET1-associated nuclear protein 1 (U3 small nucleolar RNA-associated protein 17)